MMALIDLWTDGNYRPKTALAGWAALLKWTDIHGKEISQEIFGTAPAVNDDHLIGEILAVRQGLCFLPIGKHQVTVLTDSRYVQDALTKDKILPAHRPILAEIYALLYGHTLRVQRVKGHSRIPENVRVDSLCKFAIRINHT